MCVLVDTYLEDEVLYDEIYQKAVSKKIAETHRHKLSLVTEVEDTPVTAVTEKVNVYQRTDVWWCRQCKQRTLMSESKSCECGIIMCNSCWEEWESECPICETKF